MGHLALQSTTNRGHPAEERNRKRKLLGRSMPWWLLSFQGFSLRMIERKRFMSERENDITAVMEVVANYGKRMVPVSELRPVEVPAELLEFAKWQGQQLRERPADAFPVCVAAERMGCLVCPVYVEPGDAFVSIDEDADGTWHAGHLACIVCQVCRRLISTPGGVISNENGEPMGCLHLSEEVDFEEVEEE
ncbi:hypothetical protein [Streptomyces sp. 3213.3]|uniref:hypothetical protein n=1 Tax=Streptomyces sp. 3213.3 TaxID=1855348 RepID=UPI00135C8153|nr:hypothetical protein [Streptomyces sp. 3213.3]